MKFSALPGSCERQLKRQWNNPLFSDAEQTVIQMDINKAQREDQREVDSFQKAFKQLLDDVSKLEAQSESETILLLKEQADKLYEQASGLAGDFGMEKQALQKLILSMMRAIRKGAGTDARAHYELDQEDLARQTHFEMLNFQLITDLLRPDSPISQTALVPTLLSERLDAVQAAAQLFDADALKQICQQADECLNDISALNLDKLTHARQRLELLKQVLSEKQQTASIFPQSI